MKLLPGVVYVACPACSGTGRVDAPPPEIPAEVQRQLVPVLMRALFGAMAFFAALFTLLFLVDLPLTHIAAAALRAAIFGGAVLFGGMWGVHALVTRLSWRRCGRCRGKKWVPGEPPTG